MAAKTDKKVSSRSKRTPENRAKRKEQVRIASRRRRIKQKREEAFVAYRLQQIKHYIASLGATLPAELTAELEWMSDDEFAKYFEEMCARSLRRCTSRVQALARYVNAFENPPVPCSLRENHSVPAQLSMEPMVDIATAHDAVRMAVARLDMLVPGPTDAVKSSPGVAWHADLWVRDTALHFRCASAGALKRTDASASLWQIMKTPHDYMRCHPSVKRYVLHEFDDNMIVTCSVSTLVPSQEMHVLVSLAFRVTVNTKQIVGSVVLPGYSGGYRGAHLLNSDVKGWVLEPAVGMPSCWWPSFRGSHFVRAAYEDEEIWNEMATVVLADVLRWESKALHPIE